jgi:hypothetical protein
MHVELHFKDNCSINTLLQQHGADIYNINFMCITVVGFIELFEIFNI